MNLTKRPAFFIFAGILSLAIVWFTLVKISGANFGTLESPKANFLSDSNLEKSHDLSAQNVGFPEKRTESVAPGKNEKKTPRWREAREMSPSERLAEIAEHEDAIEKENVIQRLNQNEIGHDERKEYDQLFERITLLKKINIEIASAKIAAKLADISKNHQRNLSLAGINPR